MDWNQLSWHGNQEMLSLWSARRTQASSKVYGECWLEWLEGSRDLIQIVIVACFIDQKVDSAILTYTPGSRELSSGVSIYRGHHTQGFSVKLTVKPAYSDQGPLLAMTDAFSEELYWQALLRDSLCQEAIEGRKSGGRDQCQMKGWLWHCFELSWWPWGQQDSKYGECHIQTACGGPQQAHFSFKEDYFAQIVPFP